MTKVIELLDAVKTAKNVSSDYALAKVLDLHTGLISDYYAGKRTPNEFACLQIAKALGKSYEVITALVKMETEKDESRRNAWRDYYKSIGGIAASVLCTLTCVVTLIFSTGADAAMNSGTYANGNSLPTNYASLSEGKSPSFLQGKLQVATP